MVEYTGPIQHKRGTTAEWAVSVIPLREGEIGYDKSLRRVKVGDGATLWAGLPWATPDSATVQRLQELAEEIEGAVAPTDAFVAGAINNPQSATKQALTATIAGVAEPLAEQAAASAFGVVPIVVDGVRPPYSDLIQLDVRETFAVGFGSSTMNALGGNELASLCGQLGISFYNGGVSGERLEWCEARIGSHRPLVSFPGDQIPASGTVTVTVSGTWDRSVATNDPIPGRAGGIPGTFAWVTDHYTWTRTTPGSALPLGGPVEHIADEGELRRADVLFLNLGKNTIGEAGADTRIIRAYQRVMAWAGAQRKRVIVFGHFADTNTPANGVERTQIVTVNRWLSKTFGPYYIDLYGYITGAQVWTDTGITKNATDDTQQALGNLPPSLANDTQHLNAATRRAVTDHLIAPVLTGMGYEYPLFTQIAADTFTRADAATLGTTEIGGLPWTTKRGTYSIVSNAARATATGTGGYAAATVVVPGGEQDYRVRATVEEQNCGVIARATGAQGYMFGWSTSSGGYRLRRVSSGGTSTTIGGHPAAFVAGAEIALVPEGTKLTPYVNGVAGPAVDDSTYIGTEAGLWNLTGLTNDVLAWGLDTIDN